ncbi:MAG TPA: DUF2314 domain-containing protein [Terriglobia bacterium]|nr:DUF2314 domain-containing protein [Terriglobia bacterium]
MWWKRKLDLRGLIFFSGSLAPTFQEVHQWQQPGLEVEGIPPGNDEIWAATLRHRVWGRARLSAVRGIEPLTEDDVRFASGITETERETILRDAQSALVLEMTSQADDVLRERKRFLRFMAAVMGTRGVVALDLMAQTFWTPGRLADELRHDAALDIVHIHVFHAVTQPGGIWLHSHGLSELGFVDFDVLRPAEALLGGNQFDLLRSIAFHIVEGASSGVIEPAVGAEPVALVDAPTFMRSASSADRQLRDPENHSDRRVVCCDAGAPGLLRRLLGSGEVAPSRFLSRGMIEGKHLIRFSDFSTDLTTTRARESLPLLNPFRQEFEELQCTALVKLGYRTDSGRDGREHLWFEVHGVSGDSIDATLVNQPFDIASLKVGDRDNRPAELLTDWAVMTPLGALTPRSLEVARKLREKRSLLLEYLRSQ